MLKIMQKVFNMHILEPFK